MPAEWHVPEVPSRWIKWEHARGKLAVEQVYWFSTTRQDGRPHSVPVWGLWLDDTFFFETDPRSVKASNVRSNPYVVVHTQDGYDTVIVEGRAAEENRPQMLKRLKEGYVAKYDYTPNWSGRGAQKVYRVEPDVAHAWKNPHMHQTIVRFVF